MSGPLSSLKILDFTALLPGPFATMMLADMGAEIIRIEAPHRPDLVRLMPPFDGDTSAWHRVLNRSKRALALDLKRPEAVEIIHRLIKERSFNIIVEQFRPGVMERLGLDYERLEAVEPSLIYCAITGYGQTGPLRERAGHDINYLALSGVMSHSGRRETGPTPMGVQIADVGGGSLGALVGLLAAVIHRQVTGEGQFVDISMYDMMLAWQAHIISQHLIGDETPQREALPLNGGGFYDYYETADGRFLAVGSLEPQFWQGFCKAIGQPELVSAGYTQDPRVQQEVKESVRQAMRQKTLAEWDVVFATVDVCVEPVLTIPEAVAQPQTTARAMIVEVERPDGTLQRQVASPYKFSKTPASYRHTGTALGADTDEILSEIGYDAPAIAALREAGVLGTA